MPNKKKILFFANSSFLGGAEANILALSKALKKDFNVIVAALEQGGPLLSFALKNKIRIFNPLFKSYKNPVYIFRIINFLQKEKVDYLIVFGLKLKIIILPIAWIMRVPVRISTIRGLDLWKNKTLIFIERLLSFFTSYWIANSNAAKDNAVINEKKNPNKVFVIYNGLEINNVKYPKMNSNGNAEKIGIIANLYTNKGHKFFLNVFKNLIPFFPNVSAEFVGQDFSNGEIPKLIKTYNLEQYVKYVGYKNNIREYIQKFDLLVLPSYSESLPSSIIEAMLEGIPVIASKVGGVPELIIHGKTGWLFKAGDHTELSRLLLDILPDNDLRNRIASNANNYAIKHFTIEKALFLYKNLLSNTLEKKKIMQPPLKIIRIQSRIVVGGPALHTILLSKGLNTKLFKSQLVGGINNNTEKSLISNAQKMNITCNIINEMGREINILDDLISLIKLIRLIKREKPQIVHTHTAKAGTIGRIAALLSGVPFIYHTFHGHVFKGYFNSFITKLYIIIEKQLAKITTNIIVISETQRKDIVDKHKIANDLKTKVIPLGFDWKLFFEPNNKFNFSLRNKYNIPPDKFLIAIVGRIVPIKDHGLFINIALKLIKHNESKYHFVIIGDGELRTELELKIKKHNVSQYFTFTGWIELNANIYQEINLLLLTSKNEGTPVAIIEALVAGVPVIASNVGGVLDIMEDYNISHVIDSRDSIEYENKIIQLQQDYKRIPEEVSESIKKKYSISRLVKDIEHLYLANIKILA
jgi:glycosyltransferase involved in cell wall biosynthesis